MTNLEGLDNEFRNLIRPPATSFVSGLIIHEGYRPFDARCTQIDVNQMIIRAYWHFGGNREYCAEDPVDVELVEIQEYTHRIDVHGSTGPDDRFSLLAAEVAYSHLTGQGDNYVKMSKLAITLR